MTKRWESELKWMPVNNALTDNKILDYGANVTQYRLFNCTLFCDGLIWHFTVVGEFNVALIRNYFVLHFILEINSMFKY